MDKKVNYQRQQNIQLSILVEASKYKANDLHLDHIEQNALVLLRLSCKYS